MKKCRRLIIIARDNRFVVALYYFDDKMGVYGQ